MAYFLVTMTHPDGEGWGRHVDSHVAYLRSLITVGQVRASGPVTGLGRRAGFIIMTVDSIEEAKRLVAGDPFNVEGLIDDLTILQWNPMFGVLSEDAGRTHH